MPPADPEAVKGGAQEVPDIEYQCARCGSSLAFEDCEVCPACGYWDDPDPTCEACNGNGTVPICLAGREWCQTHPLPGRENVPRHTPEVFDV